MAKKQALGKGLGALIKTQGIGSNITGPGNQKSGPGTHENDVRNVPIGQIIASPLQPRKHFTEGMLDDLMESIAQHGIIQLSKTPFHITSRINKAIRYHMGFWFGRGFKCSIQHAGHAIGVDSLTVRRRMSLRISASM